LSSIHIVHRWGKELSKVIRVRYEKGVLKPLEPLDLEEGEEAVVVLKEDLVVFARRIRKSLKKSNKEPSELLSLERNRFE
jgi:predicted DNA-binding antitoxin AbrB/MazE fold protein